MRNILLFQVVMLLGVSLALDLRYSDYWRPTTIELQRNKRLASPTNFKANPFLQDDEDRRLTDYNPSLRVTLLRSRDTLHSAGRARPLARSRRDAVDRVLSIFGGSIPQRGRHLRPNGWRPVHSRPHLGGLKHHRPPPHKLHHIRGPKLHGPYPPKHYHGGSRRPHHQKYRGSPEQHGRGPHKHHDDHFIHDDHQEHHHHFEEHHEGDIIHGGDDLHHDEGPTHHDEGPIHHDEGPIHHDVGPVHHEGEAHYDDHSINDIHDYPEHEYIVEYDDGGLVFGHHDHSFKPSLPDHLHRPFHEPDYHHDPHHDPHHDTHFEPHHDHHDDHLSHNPGYLAGITKNSIYRDDVPFKEVVNDNDKVHDGLQPGGVKGLDPELISFISDKTRPYVIREQ